ncbi:MAG: MFS transporter [Candidatus Dormibacteraeota bacterium]|nr:MFS transporter [Candidatus Dormibacteraeota bacterium]
MSVTGFIDAMLRSHTLDWATTQRNNCRTYLLSPTGRFQGWCAAAETVAADDLTTAAAADFLAAMADPRRGAGLKPTTVAKYLIHLRALARFQTETPGFGAGLADIARIRAPRMPRERVVMALTRDEEERVVAAFPTTRDRLMIELLLATGLRVSEAAGLLLPNVLLSARPPRVLVVGSVHDPDCTKSRRPRQVPFRRHYSSLPHSGALAKMSSGIRHAPVPPPTLSRPPSSSYRHSSSSALRWVEQGISGTRVSQRRQSRIFAMMDPIPANTALPRRIWFGVGSAAVAAGVVLHLPKFFGAADSHYALNGMGVDPLMVVGMVLITVGMGAVVFGLTPTHEQRRKRVRQAVLVSALDDTPIGRAHVGLMAILTVAIAIDSQKPFTFTFILPGVAAEYGLSTPVHPAPGHLAVALYPFVAIVGTVIGSLVWGYVGDRLGRRTAILLAAILFVATAICGAMPMYLLNLAMCFVMGIAAGGLLPTAYALLTEIIPAQRRGQIVVLVAGVGTGLGFLLTSALATWLIPHFGWRVMWFFGLPTGLILIVLNRFIPESPRFLVEYGRVEEAGVIMSRFGAALVNVGGQATASADSAAHRLLRGRLGRLTLVLILYGVAWGVVNFGFLTWLPIDFASSGVSLGQVSHILTNAALFSLPGAVVVSWFYRRSSKLTMAAIAALSSATLVVFAAAGESIAAHTTLFTALLVCLLVSLWGVISVLAPYSAEIYPTSLRARGAGVAAGASKLGGVIALGVGVVGLTTPGLAMSGGLTAAAMAVAAVAMAMFGIETRRRRLEDIDPTGRPIAAA